MYGKIPTKPNYPELEHGILKFWREQKIFERLREKNRSGPHFKFLDGPITANNPMGVHHAWGRTYKDVFQRYRAMTGHHMRYQNGFDCQGLWVEVEVEKELGFRSKRDIEAFGIGSFVEKCKARVRKYSEIQTQQSVRLGYWMDWSNSYYTMSDENNYTIWHFLKKCHERGWVYRGEDVMPWCARCGTGISQQEMHEGYKWVADRAVFVRFRRKGVSGEEYLLVWTTTPWTLTSNVAAAVNPELTYAKVRHRDAIYYLAVEALGFQRKREEFQKGAWIEGVPALESPAEIFRKAGGFETVGTVRGSEMVGWTYEGPFDELPAQEGPGGFPRANPALSGETGISCHRVIPWGQVGATEGTGIVHIAPGCGKEDYDLGKAHQLVSIAPLREDGVYAEGFDWLSGLSATDRETTEKILADLEARGVLVAAEDYPHSYPHCWRCASPLVFRQVDEWFIRMDELRLQIMEVAKAIRWMPEFGLEQELDWLRNMRDWMITKKRYWGLALPIYPCKACGAFEVIGSREELRERAVSGWPAFEGHSPHRPWVDEVKIACPKCGAAVSRIPDVGNPWLDAGIVPFSTTGYLTNREQWERWYPFDFITECFPGQFRNWFYSLLAMSTVLENREPFRCVLGHALLHDEKGQEMHKSQGNVVWFDEAAEKMGVDVMRWMFVKQNPFQNLNFGYPAGEGVRKRLLTLWNLCSFFTTYASIDKPNLGDPPSPREVLSLMDRWVLSRLQGLIHTAHRCYREYDLPPLVREVETFLDELSTWYLRRSRRRFWKSADDQDKRNAYRTLFEALSTLLKVVAPCLPFTAEEIYQSMIRPAEPGAPASIHLATFPVARDEFADSDLEEGMTRALRIVTLAHSARAAAGIKVRQPLAAARVAVPDAAAREALRRFSDVVLDEINVKALAFVESNEDLTERSVRPNLAVMGRRFGRHTQAVKEALQRVDPAEALVAAREGRPLALAAGGETFEVTPAEFEVLIAGKGGWVVQIENDLSVALDTRLDDALTLEGHARDLVRHIQTHRKAAGLEVSDRIVLTYAAEGPLADALSKAADFIREEVLAVSMAPADPPQGEYVGDAKIGKSVVRFGIRKA